MVRLENVTARRGAFTLSADFAVEKGAHLSLIGPSGGGKSTLLDVISGFLIPYEGAVRLNGADVTAAAPADRPVTMLFQEHNLFPHLDVRANVGLGLNANLRLAKADEERIQQALADVGLDGFAARRPADLSGGQRQRVAIARALLRDRPVLLLDEPFAALGPAQRAEMLELVADLRAAKGVTVIMVTHSPEDARRAAGDIAVVAEGRVAPPQDAASILSNPPEALAAYLGAD
ncbi:MAG: thiamine ABC transporter ATP-binding protein [Pseudomonadota bacterium]